MRRLGISYAPIVFTVVGILAGLALVNDHNVRTWAVVLSFTTVAAVGYGAYQEQRASRLLQLARRHAIAPHDELRREMDRARRHERPFAVARIDLVGVARHQPLGRVIGHLRAESTRPTWRSTDRIWRTNGSLYLLMPDSNAVEARVAIDRLRSLDGGQQLGESRVVAFPEDGLTVGALFEALLGHVPPSEALLADDMEPEATTTMQPERVANRDRWR